MHSLHWWFLMYCRDNLKVERCCMESYIVEGQGGSSQFTKLKTVQLALDVTKWEKSPLLYLYTDLLMVENGPMEKDQLAVQRETHLGCRSVAPLPRWRSCLQSTSCRCTIPKSWVTEEYQSNGRMDQGAKVEASQVDLDWQQKGELFLPQCTHDASDHQGRDATSRLGSWLTGRFNHGHSLVISDCGSMKFNFQLDLNHNPHRQSQQQFTGWKRE